MTLQAKQRVTAGTVTVVLLLIIYFLMVNSAIPKRDLVAQRYDEINWTLFKPRKITFQKTEEAAPEPEPEKAMEPEAPVVQRIDLQNDLFEQLDLGALEMPTRTPQAPGKQASREESNPLRLELDQSAFANDFNLALDENSPLLQSSRGKGRSQRSGGVTLEAEEGVDVGRGLGEFEKDVGADLQGPTAYGKSGGAVKIGLKKLSDFGPEYDDLTGIYKPLVEWMKLHPAELPDVVKRFMGYIPGNLTSWVHFSIGERQFEMFLLCVEESYEVRIVLVENREVTYLIDQGFRKKSNFLRIGAVDRLPDGEILKFGTTLEPAGNRRAEEFYQVFLSWWEEVKHEVEK